MSSRKPIKKKLGNCWLNYWNGKNCFRMGKSKNVNFVKKVVLENIFDGFENI